MSANRRNADNDTVEDLDGCLVEIDDAMTDLRREREEVARQRAMLLGEPYPRLELVRR